jgi:uncharacterized Tic20 family protein
MQANALTLDQGNAPFRTVAASVHAGACLVAILTCWAAGFGGMAVAGLLWVLFKNRSEFVAAHAKEAFNFNLSPFIYSLVGMAFAMITFGIGLPIVWLFWGLVGIGWLVFSIQATMAAYRGDNYRYPFALRLVS